MRNIRVDDLVQQYRYYPPDCIAYTTSRSSAKGTLFVVCGNRTPIAVDAYFTELATDGIRNTTRVDLRSGLVRVEYKIVHAAQVRALGEQQPPFRRDWTRDPEHKRGVRMEAQVESTRTLRVAAP